MLKKFLSISVIALATLCFVSSCKNNSGTKPGQSTEKIESSTKGIEKEYELIISPCGKPSMMFSKFKPFAKYLSQSTGLKIELFVPRNLEEFTTKVKTQESGFFYMDPAIYLSMEGLINRDHVYGSLCGFIDKHRGKLLETGCIITRSDSNIKTIKDLKGTNVIFGPKNSATKWIAAKKTFIENGIDLEKDLGGYSFGGSCMDIVLDIYHKKADVGCIRTLMCPVHNPSLYYKHSGLDTTQLLNVAETSPVMTWVFTCTKSADERDMEKVGNALRKISKLDLQEKELLPADTRYGFVRIEDSDFDDLRKMAE